MVGYGFAAIGAETVMPAAAVLGASRALGIMTIFPVFSLFNISGILRFGLAIGLSAPSVAFAFSYLSHGSITYVDLGLFSLKEFAFGVLLGIGLGVPFWAAQAAGDMTDIYRGANAANLFDQINALQTAPLGSLLMSFSLALFVTAGGMVDLIAIFYKSFAFWPINQLHPEIPQTPLKVLVDIFARIFRVGALLASPFVIIMASLELALSYTGRSARQLQLNDMVSTIKNFAVVVILVFYVAFISSYVRTTWVEGFNQVRSILEVPGG